MSGHIIDAERAIMRGLATFARVLDQKNWDALGTVFAQDVTFDYGSGEVQRGIAALRDQMTRFLDRCGPTQHLLGSILIDVDGAQATSSAYVQARHQRAGDPVGPIFDSCGDYHDCWALLPDGWRIVHRHAIWFMHSGDPAILDADGSDLH